MSDHDLETALRATLAGRAADAPAGDDLADTVTRVGTARRRRRRIAGAAAVLAVGAVAGLAGRGLVPVAGDAEPVPADTPPATALITCNPHGWPAFDPGLLTERPRLDPDSDLGTAVRTTARPHIAARLIDGWTLVDEVGSTAYLLIWLKDTEETRNMVEGGLASAAYDRAADGSWTYVGGGGGCEPQRYFDDGLDPVEWRLPSEQPTPDATSVTILASEIGCSSGQASDDRLAEPIVEYHEDAVDITLRIIPPEGGLFTCIGNPETAVTVELDEPLGDRELRDGLWYPPRLETPEP